MNWLRPWCILVVFAIEPSTLSLRTATAKDVVTIQRGLSSLDLTDLKRHVTTLASDALEGREAGGRGGKAALAYLRSELKRMRTTRKFPLETTQEFGRDFQNLLVLIPGSDEKLKKEVIVVGAHYDHVGYGNPTNSKGPFGQIHNGADDNASGTAAVLELIQAFTSLDTPPPRSMLFAFWDAEEVGLLGSKHWVAYPTLPLQDVRFAMNIDMLGRMRDQRVVSVGWRSAAGLRSILATNNVSNQLKLAFQGRVNPDSDHYPFYSSNIPIIHLDTDKHDDYHRPTDDPERLNWDGLLQLTEFAFRVLMEVSSRADLPPFRTAAHHEPIPNWLSPLSPVPSQIRLGITWDSDLAKRDIAKIAQVNSDSPASRAGLRVGDRVIRMGQWERGTFDDLKTLMLLLKNPVQIQVEREDSAGPIDIEVNFWGSPLRLGAGWIDDPALPNCVAITHVVAESPADRSGISAGDIVMRMNDKPIASADDFRTRVLEEPGPVILRIERSGCIRDVTVDLLDHPIKKAVERKAR